MNDCFPSNERDRFTTLKTCDYFMIEVVGRIVTVERVSVRMGLNCGAGLLVALSMVLVVTFCWVSAVRSDNSSKNNNNNNERTILSS
jgi:hypothetical protein